MDNGRPSSPSTCTYAVLARRLPSAKSDGGDLLLAFSQDSLQVYARKTANTNCSCHQDTADPYTRYGFQCPHLESYDDYEPTASIPFTAAFQVLMTYRTTSASSIATRTKDLLLVCHDETALWIDFEHNLARGWFLEALTTALPAIPVDYVDLADSTLVLPDTVNLTSFILKSLSCLVKKEDFLRDALRHVIYEKIKLSLQIAQENDVHSGDEHAACHLLLSTAKYLAVGLDEPDLTAFAWLASGFINMLAMCASKKDLAVDQVTQSLEIARENSLTVLTSLALHCLADLHLQRGDDPLQATELLVEAARLAPPDSMEPAMKMQVHRKIHDLRAFIGMEKALTPTEDSDKTSPGKLVARKSRSAFSLWQHTFGERSTRSQKELLLSKVHKPADNSGGSCFVDAIGAQGARKARFRVFFDATHTFTWLQHEIRSRLEGLLVDSDNSVARPVRVEIFYDPQGKRVVTLMDTRLSEWVRSKDHTMHAKLGLTVLSTHHSATETPTTGPVVALSEAAHNALSSPDPRAIPVVTCSLCHQKIPLDDVEEHSETCY
ncbi:hypothetical protein Poli38472_001685 [Pythium oligandrum]|uniref:Uncharacterized protein n=1 Tax=Pythium oligandrum TaxID=41045 RepID=A0A8K1CUL1_PYTOL|nr:hypothetical protein Poli38472_001685 [Pythium oligandrum]|eukprot:TMW69529.1 hypothetical protein Poli38472_001685 [Pythium oligandrum]